MAEHMALSAETEKTYAAQFETVLDNANNGIFEIDEKRKITIINRTVEELLKKSAEKVNGEALESFFPELDIKYVNDVLEGRRDMFTTSTYLAGILTDLNNITALDAKYVQYPSLLSIRKYSTASLPSGTLPGESVYL